jgi:endo-1,4-beta-xylanase
MTKPIKAAALLFAIAIAAWACAGGPTSEPEGSAAPAPIIASPAPSQAPSEGEVGEDESFAFEDDLFTLEGLDYSDEEEATYEEPPEQKIPFVGLRDLATARGLELGVAFDFKFANNERYRRLVTSEFNSITPENVLKWEYMRGAQASYDWFFGDYLTNFVEEHSMKLRGHALVWHSQLPSWVGERGSDRESMLALVREYCYDVVSRYKGRIHKWDVLNEVIADGGGMRESVFYQRTGVDYIEAALRSAHEADPGLLLYINDYSVEGLNPKSDTLYELCKDLLSRGVPLHGVGFQSHLDLDRLPTIDSFRRNVKRFLDLGLKVDITELDIRIKSPVTPEREAAQTEYFKAIFEMALELEGLDTVVLWGLSDNHSWIPGFLTGYGSALIIDSFYHPKESYRVIAELLAQEP